MKLAIVKIIVAFAIGIISTDVFAQSNVTSNDTIISSNDSILNAMKLNALKLKKETLTKMIKEADNKRNSQIAGVSADRMESMNNYQDSVCLALRSDLTDVILEIKELSPEASAPQLLQQYHNLFKQREENQK